MPNTWNIALDYTNASSDPLIVNVGDKVTWTNEASNIITLTLPDCVSGGAGPVQLAAGAVSRDYTITGGGPGTHSYSWQSGISPANVADICIVTAVVHTAISLSADGAAPVILQVNPGDTVTWTNDYPGTALELTLPPCVSPHNSPVLIPQGLTTRNYTVNAQKGAYMYSWVTGSTGSDAGTIDVS